MGPAVKAKHDHYSYDSDLQQISLSRAYKAKMFAYVAGTKTNTEIPVLQ